MIRSMFLVLVAILVLPSIAAAQQTIDVYIIAGQSNTDGRGNVSDLSQEELASVESNTIISYLNPGSERERTQSQSTPPDLDVGTNGFTALVPGGFSVDGTSARVLTPTFGPELAFGATIAGVTGSSNQIAIIKVSRGGTNFRNDWLANPNVNTVDDEPEGFLYRAMLERIATSLTELEADGSTAVIRGFVWHQGESDSSTSAVAAYAGRFLDLVQGVRAEFGDEIPFVIGELSRTRDNSVEFNDNLPNVVSVAPNISFIGSEGVTAPANDTTHFDANGQLELGRRFAAAFDGIVIDPEPEPEPEPLRSVLFDFQNDGSGVIGADPAGSDFDPGVTGDTITVDGLTATIVDVTAPEYDTTGDVPVLTGNILSSASGDNVNTNVSGQDALGINNSSVSNNDFELIGNGTEGNDLNPGETVTITFDQPVRFTSIELESVIAEDSFDVLIDGEVVLETTGDDSFIDDLGGLTGLTIAAGSEITFAVDGVLSATGGPSTSVRLERFMVEVFAEAEPEPEPTLLGDVNRDGVVDFLDISPFIAVLSAGEFQAEADIDQNELVDFLDISPFIGILSGQ